MKYRKHHALSSNQYYLPYRNIKKARKYMQYSDQYFKKGAKQKHNSDDVSDINPIY